LFLAVSLYASVLAIERGLRPLAELATSANAISASDWHLKLTGSSARVVELAPLTSALSRMLETLHSAFQQQRDFTSNAAHELKTPVAVLKSTLQSLLQETRTTEAYREGISDALSDLERLETLLHSMLRLARAEQRAASDGAPDRSEVDVVGACEAAIARLAPIAESRQSKIVLTAPSGFLTVRAEAEDLEIIWSNLIENAVRYSPNHTDINVTAGRYNGSVIVTVEDNGPGLSASEIPKIFDRFHRGDSSRSRETGGFGLGLAIAKAFAECYGGSISADANQPKGTRIQVALPSSQ
jgi:signal transduction histidine kinase